MARAGRVLLLLLLAAGIVAGWHWRHLVDPLLLARIVARSPMTPLAFLALHVAASLFFVPRTVMALAAGLLFGMWWGIVWAGLGSFAGALAGFLVARYIHAGFVRRAESARLRALTAHVERGGWRMVAMVRLVPVIPHSLTNYALGLTRLRLGAYGIGSLLGQLPLTIAYAELGAGGRALAGGADWWHQMLWPSLIGLGALALSLAIPAVARRRWRAPAPMPGE